MAQMARLTPKELAALAVRARSNSLATAIEALDAANLPRDLVNQRIAVTITGVTLTRLRRARRRGEITSYQVLGSRILLSLSECIKALPPKPKVKRDSKRPLASTESVDGQRVRSGVAIPPPTSQPDRRIPAP